jgi:cytochrome P450
MRLWPVIPINTRVATVDTVLPRGGGPDGKSPVFVCAGTPVTLHTYAMHRREDIGGKDAREFRHERWDTKENRVQVLLVKLHYFVEDF